MADISERDKLILEVYRRLGGGMVDIELTPDHFTDALNFALSTYRQRSSNSREERFGFIELQPNETTYTLPKEVIDVRQILRMGYGGAITGVANEFEPFAASVANQVLMGGGTTPSLTTYELFTSFQETVGRMFGFNILFSFNSVKKELNISRTPKATELVMLWLYMDRPDDIILQDVYARPWIFRFTTAYCKVMLGEARGKIQNLAGPQGGTTLNGAEMKTEGEAEMAVLIEEIKNQVDQSEGYGFIIG